jgi:flagellar biosynthesis protein FliR
MPAASAEVLAAWLTGYFAVLARLSFIVFLMPGLGEQVIPARVRVFVLIGLSAIMSSAGVIALPGEQTVSTLMGMIASELAIGLALGVMLRLAIWVLAICGALLAQAMGLSQFMGVSLEDESQTLIANILTLAGSAVLVTADVHVRVVAALIDLYAVIPAGDFLAVDIAQLTRALIAGLTFAVLLAWPFVLVSFLYNVCLGFLNKALPSLMVSFVGAPFMVGAGLVMLAFTITGLLLMWQERALDLAGWL